jgi:GNAT superfamily N-acetyltransferase
MLRPLAQTDAAATAALIRDCFASQAVDPPPSAARETTASIAEAIAAGGGFGVERDGQLLAVVLWQEADGGLYLGRLAVAEAARRQGLAQQLVDAVEAEARRRGLPRLHLKVRLPLLDNRRLFRCCGFVETTLHAHDGYAEPTYCVMEKRLMPACVHVGT